jgi:hypothetical protein
MCGILESAAEFFRVIRVTWLDVKPFCVHADGFPQVTRLDERVFASVQLFFSLSLSSTAECEGILHRAAGFCQVTQQDERVFASVQQQFFPLSSSFTV